MPSPQRTSHAGEPERPNLVDHRQARALTRPGCRRVPAASVTSVTRWATKVTGQPGPRIRRTAGPGRGSPRRPPVARTNFRPSPHRTAPAPVYRVRLTLTARKGTIYVDRGEQGCRGPVVHGVLGRGLQPGRHR